MALYSSAVVMKGFNSSRKLLKTGLLLNALQHICPLTFINNALHLFGSPFVASTALP